jgi:metal-responsive CopG/Arc/MetJ family transcriptional regulator
MKTAISLPDDLYARVEAFARQRGLSRSEFFQKAAELLLEADNARFVREALDRVYGSEESRIDQSAMLAQTESFDREDW